MVYQICVCYKYHSPGSHYLTTAYKNMWYIAEGALLFPAKNAMHEKKLIEL